MLAVEPVPAFADNYLWILSVRSSKRAVCVDPGDAGPVIQALDRRDMVLDTILLTHHHYDHIGGVAELAERSPGVAVIAPDDPRVPYSTQTVSEGDCITIACLNATFQVMEVPGHTCSHIAYYGDGKLFCGDTLFACGCGRLFEGTPRQMSASLDKIMHLPDDTEIYCAHEYTLANINFAKHVEPENHCLIDRERIEKQKRARHQPTVPSVLSLEKATNPFLRCDYPDVVAAATRYSGHELHNPVEVFAAIRRWKDQL